MNIQQVENLSPFEILEKGITLCTTLDKAHDFSIDSIHIFNDLDYLNQSVYDLPGHYEIPDLHKLLVKYRSNEKGGYNNLSDAEKLLYDKFTDLHWGVNVMLDGYNNNLDYYGDEFSVVYHFPTSNLYVKFEGSADSHSDSRFNKKYEVKKQEKQITVYEYK